MRGRIRLFRYVVLLACLFECKEIRFIPVVARDAQEKHKQLTCFSLYFEVQYAHDTTWMSSTMKAVLVNS
jgi:hypothetical protein